MYLLLPKYTSEIYLISIDHTLEKKNWLPVSDRVEHCTTNTTFKYWNGIVPGYTHEMFKPSLCR